MPELYGELKSLIDELEMHQPAVTDAVILRGNCQDLTVSKILSGLISQAITCTRSDTGNCYFLQNYACLLKLMCPLHHLLSSLSWTQDVAEVVVAVMMLEEDVASFEGVCGSLVADIVALIKGPSNVSIVPCFKYWPSQPRYRPISLFLPAADTIWEYRSPYRLQQKTADIWNIGR